MLRAEFSRIDSEITRLTEERVALIGELAAMRLQHFMTEGLIIGDVLPGDSIARSLDWLVQPRNRGEARRLIKEHQFDGSSLARNIVEKILPLFRRDIKNEELEPFFKFMRQFDWSDEKREGRE